MTKENGPVVNDIVHIGGDRVAEFTEPRMPMAVAFSTRDMGDMSEKYERSKGEAMANFRRFRERIWRFSPERRHRVHMVPAHKTRVLNTEDVIPWEYRRDQHTSTTLTGYDALITEDSHVYITVFPADCPIAVLADNRKRFLAVVHVGWRSAKAGIIDRTLDVLEGDYGTKKAETLWTALVPGIRSCCYRDRRTARHLLLRNWAAPLNPITGKIDLPAKVELALMRQRIAYATRWLDPALCTYCSQDKNGNPLLYSNRRFHDRGRAQKRFAVAAALTP